MIEAGQDPTEQLHTTTIAVFGRRHDMATASEESFEFVCGPCSIDGSNLQAMGYCADCGEYLCESCYKYHLKPLPCRHHVLLDTNNMPKDKKLVSVRDTCTERCPTHFGKLLEFICPVHDHFVCNVCMTVSHRSCEGIAYIADEVDDLYTSDEYVSLKMKLAGIEASIADNRKKNKQHEFKAETIHTRAIDDVKAFRRDINDFLDKIETATETRAKDLNDQNIASTKQISKRCDSLATKHQSLVANIDSKHSLNQKCNLYVAMKRAKGSVEKYEELLKGISNNNDIQRYVFQPEKEILKIVKTAVELGQLSPEVQKKQTAKDVKDSASDSKANNDEGDEENDEVAEESEEEEDGYEEISGDNPTTTGFTVLEATFSWTVENISNLTGQVLSPECVVRDLPWKIQAKKGTRTEWGTYFGFWLQCNANSNSKLWSCNAEAVLQIINQKSGGDNFVRKIQHVFSCKENDWGYSKFISWNELIDSKKGYCIDDKLTLQVHVKADAPK